MQHEQLTWAYCVLFCLVCVAVTLCIGFAARRASYWQECPTVHRQLHALGSAHAPSHLNITTLQLLAVVGMEQPVSSHPDDIRDEKCKVLRCINPVRKEVGRGGTWG
jgi:hypothetical protein